MKLTLSDVMKTLSALIRPTQTLTKNVSVRNKTKANLYSRNKPRSQAKKKGKLLSFSTRLNAGQRQVLPSPAEQIHKRVRDVHVGVRSYAVAELPDYV